MPRAPIRDFRITPDHFASSYTNGLMRLRAYKLVGGRRDIGRQELLAISRETGISDGTLNDWAKKGRKPKVVHALERIEKMLPINPEHPNFNKFLLMNYAAALTGSVGAAGKNLVINAHPDELKAYENEVFKPLGIPVNIVQQGPNKHVLKPGGASILGRAVELMGYETGRGAKLAFKPPRELGLWARVIKAHNRGVPFNDERSINTARRAIQDFSAVLISSKARQTGGRQWYMRLPLQKTREGAESLGNTMIHVLDAAMPTLGISSSNMKVEIGTSGTVDEKGQKVRIPRWSTRITFPAETVEQLQREYPQMTRFSYPLRGGLRK